MNAAISAGLPAIPVPPAQTIPEPPARLGRLLPSLVLAVAAFDLCFWGVKAMGFSVAVFVLVFAAMILINRDAWRKKRSSLLLLALLVGAAFATIIEMSMTNTLSLLVLLLLLAGDTWFNTVELPWGRWISQVIACLFAPGRVFWLFARMIEAASKGGAGWVGGILGAGLLALPALILAVLFGSLLATGNAVFGSWTGNFFDWLWNELALFLDGSRIALWLFVAFLVMPFLRPARISPGWWNWIPRLPRLPELVPTRGAFFSSLMILVVLNLLFLVANAADAMFLWTGNALPAGVTYSGFVHKGVNALTVTVILSAFVLAGLFQQNLNVARRQELKVLGLLWIAQNLFLLISVVLRLKLYIEAYDMTVARLSVIIFLLLVAVGYGLLTIKIVREKSLPWLIGGCALAVFATFYLTQFLNLAGWTADYNVARFEEKPTRNLDFNYLEQLGPAAWPALRHAGALLPNDPFLSNEWRVAHEAETKYPQAVFDAQHWREFSLRAYWNSGALEDKK
jgi:Domain of unknown function (DUF4173)